MDDMGRGFPSNRSYRNEGESTSGSSQARSSSVPTAYGSFQIGSGGGMASTLPSNSAFAGHTQSQAANIMEGAMSPTYTQSHLAAGNVPPEFWDRFQRRRLQSPAENTEGIFPSHPHGSAIPGADIVGDTAWVNYSPSPQLGQSYPGVAGNVPTEFISHTNVGQNAFQLAGAPYSVQWRGYGAVPILYQPLNYPNQSTGGFLSAGLGSNAAPVTWVDYQSRNMSGYSYQTVVPQPDASFTGGYQYNNNNNSTRVDQRGQSSEQTAPYDFYSTQGAAVRGNSEYDHWITLGHSPSPSHASSALRIPSGSFSAPPSQGPDPTMSSYVVQENIFESSHGSQAIPRFPSQPIGNSSHPSSRRWKSHDTRAYVGGSSSSALREPVIVRPIQPPFPMATPHPVHAGGSSSSALPGPVIPTLIQPSLVAAPHPAYVGGSSSSASPEPIIFRPIQPSLMTTPHPAYVGGISLRASPEHVTVGPIQPSPMTTPHPAYVGGSSPRASPEPVTVRPIQPSPMTTHPAYVGGSSPRASPEPVTVRPTRSSPMATPRPAYNRGSSSSGLPKPVRARPIRSSPRATPHRARGEPSLPFKRPPSPQKHATYASPSAQPMQIYDDDDDSDSDLWVPQPQDKWQRVDISDSMPKLLGFKCELCNLDLAINPPGTSPNMVHVVLPCGHCYHSSCYDEVHGVVGKDEDPPCFLCPGNEA